ncbi:MAG TPA: enoyl-CoA hydratase-related protein [Modicisalibacter sp.]|nr:enoyl-CoA hydratase-related protein [Modicisalibacter sp.]
MATENTHLEFDERGVARLTLDRPDVHNAFDDALIREINNRLDTIAEAIERGEIRVVVLGSEGKHFSAGADLGWMKRMAGYDFKYNIDDSRELSRLMHRLDTLPCPTLCRVQGAAYGGAVGLAACCDIVVASEAARFCLSEVKIGLSPAIISPYVQRAIGARQMRRYALSAEVIDVSTAQRLGLVHEIASVDELDSVVDAMIDTLLAPSPQAQRVTKTLLAVVARDPDSKESRENCCQTISKLRVSDEGQEGLAAFFEKRDPAWRIADDPETKEPGS